MSSSMMQRFFRGSRLVRSFSTDTVAKPCKRNLAIAELDARKAYEEGQLGFDPKAVSTDQLLAWHNLYMAERETICYRQSLLKLGKKALKQIRENRLPSDSKYASETPKELLQDTVTDHAVIAWYMNIVANFERGETSAVAEFARSQKKEPTKHQIAQRESLVAALKEIVPAFIPTDEMTIDALRKAKKDAQDKIKEEKRFIKQQEKEAAQRLKNNQRAFTARALAARLYQSNKLHVEQGKPDLREVSDEFLLKWYDGYLQSKKQEKLTKPTPQIENSTAETSEERPSQLI